MTDLDTTIKNLINSAVDAELAGHRVAPPFRQADPHRSRPAGWVAPLLAAVVAALVALGSVAVVVGGGHLPSGRRSANRPAPSVGNSAPPGATSAEPTKNGAPVLADPQAAERAAYLRLAAISPEATVAAGVQVDPVRTAPVPRDSELVTMFSLPSLLTPSPTITLPPELVSDAPGQAGVLSFRFVNSDGTVGRCPGSFLVSPHHTYLITCSMTPRKAAAVATFTVTLRTPTASWEYAYDLPPT